MKISIITACYNSEATLADAIESVLAQDYHNIEYIIVDGSSTDSTMEIVGRYKEKISHVISEPDKGIYDALNKGIEAATGDFVGFVHSDDVLARTDAIQSVVDAAKANPGTNAIYGDLNYVQADDINKVFRRWVSKPFKQGLLSQGWMPAHPSLYMQRSCYDKFGLFDLKYKIAADYESILRFFSQPGFKAVYLPKVLVKMRVGGASNGSFKAIVRKSREDYLALKSNNIRLPLVALFLKNASKIKQFL